MTYDWNKMVDITVPAGTNGWVYSGEVIINGVKVKFPVGTPTTVPEPAAALLNKMIELEKEDDLNTAKPNNHYIGDVTVPEGKTLTIMKGAKVVDEDGALGGNAGGGGVFVVNGVVEINGAPDELGNFYGTIDKTPEEIANAHNAGQIVQLRCALTGALNGTAVMNVSVDAGGMLAWEGTMMGMYFTISMEGGSRISLQIMQLQMTNPFG